MEKTITLYIHYSLDAVLHHGDYIYEYAANRYPRETLVVPGRALLPPNDVETVSLTQYRNRYALYHSDTDLQAAHASAVFITAKQLGANLIVLAGDTHDGWAYELARCGG